MVLALAPDRRLDPERSAATIADLIKLGSQIVANTGNTKLIALVSTILGAIGLGNSALLPVAKGYTGAIPPTNLDASQAALINVLKQLEPGPLNAASIKNVTQEQVQVIHNLLAANLQQLSPDLLHRLQDIAPQVVAHGKLPDLTNLFTQISSLQPPPVHPTLNTVFDILPQVFTGSGPMNFLTTGLSLAANTFLPGVGGSLAALGIGLATNFFSNQIRNSRMQDHRTAKNVGR
jgi:hypothetical protein